MPPERLLKATVSTAMYSIRSERAFCGRLNYDLSFKWFLDMRIDQPAFDATTFAKNRTRPLQHAVADEFFAAVVRLAKLRRYISSAHFSVDGTLLNAWASHPRRMSPKCRWRTGQRLPHTARELVQRRSRAKAAQHHFVCDSGQLDVEMLHGSNQW